MGNFIAANKVSLICHWLLRPTYSKKFFSPVLPTLDFQKGLGLLFYFVYFAFISSAFSALFSISPRHILIWLAKKKRKEKKIPRFQTRWYVCHFFKSEKFTVLPSTVIYSQSRTEPISWKSLSNFKIPSKQ